MLGAEKIVIVYFSYTGNTRKLANQIHECVGGDIIEIKPVSPYSADYNKIEDQVLKEQQENYMPEIQTKAYNMEFYNTILVGSPIWWFEIAPPVKTFLKKIESTGKKIALFTTHEWSLWSGRSDDNIEELCSKSTILKSFSIRGGQVEFAEKEILEWLRELKIMY